MTASAARRRTIILDQCEPKDFIVPLYSDAQIAVSKFLATKDPRFLVMAMQELRLRSCRTNWDQTRRDNQIRALELALPLGDRVDLDDVECSLGEVNPPPLSVNGVDISVRPDVVLSVRDRRGRVRTGAIKLYFSKGHPFDDEAGAYAATLVHTFVERQVRSGKPDPSRCFVLDVFGGCVFTAPPTWKRRTKDIEAACEEIRLRWVV